MPVVRNKSAAALWCVLLMVLMAGCRGSAADCPQGSVTAEPITIPEGLSETNLFVDVHIPYPIDGLVAVTELSAVSGTIADPFARATTYACAHDVSGPVEVCVKTVYVDADAEGGALSEVPGVGAVLEYIRPSHIRLPDPLECSTLNCTVVTCPEDKNECPEVSSLTIDPMGPVIVPEGEKATITVVADDPDDNPNPLVTTLTARAGTIADANARETTYTCNPDDGGAIAICVDASDGACTDTVCELVRCPGEPDENTCPIIQDMNADPNPIPRGMDSSIVVVTALDPDGFPEPLSVEWTSDGGGFLAPDATETTFTCGEPGDVDVCVEVSDGDLDCVGQPNTKRCMTIRCPGDVVSNLCPNLNVINTYLPSINQKCYPDANLDEICVETRGWDTDRRPFPMTLTLSALWGSFNNVQNQSCAEVTEDCQLSSNVVFQNAGYVCDRPGEVELCVDATDGACTKTSCKNVICPNDIPSPP